MTYATVRAATSPELAYIRSAGQWSKLYLAIFKPATVYTARLASLPSTFDRVAEIAFNTGSGTLADVFPGMTLYVGSTAGAYDLGVARIRKAAIAGTFYIGEESEINWTASCYLTVVNEFDLWAKHINTVSDTLFYMDYDITYTNQNTVFDPIPIMGGHRVLKLVGASISTVFDFSNSYVIGSTITGYSTACATSSGLTGGTTATPTITFNTPGWHAVYLTVTAANGKTFRGVRYVYVYSSASMPSTVFQLGSCSVDYETGGWSFSVTMQDEIGLADVPERTMCILFAEDYYAGTNVSIGQLAGCENIICVGKIGEERISINPEQSEVTLRILGMHYWLSQTYAFPTGVLQTTTTPTNWAEMQSPTVAQVVFRLLHWGSTATAIMDCYLPTSEARLAKELVAPSSNIWGQINELAFTSIYARPGVDRFGRFFLEVEPQLVPAASRTWATVMTITKEDWQENVNVQRVVVTPVGMVDASGVVVYSSGTGDAIFSLSPGHVFKRYGSPEVADRLLLSTQALSNQIAGLLLGWRNNPLPSCEFRLSANNRMIDCFPRQKLAWSIATTDTPRTFAVSANFIPRRVEIKWSSQTGFLEVDISVEMEGVEQLSANGDVPGDGGADLTDPPAPPAYPPVPDWGVIIPSDIPVPEAGTVLAYDTNNGFVYTINFDADSPHWAFTNGGMDVGDPVKVNQYLMTPNGAVYAMVYTTQSRWSMRLYRAPALGQPFVKVLAESWLTANGQNSFHGMGYNPFQPEQVAFITTSGGSYENARFWLGGNTSWVAKVAIGGWNTNFSGNFTYGAGKWVYNQVFSGNQRLLRFNADGSVLENTGSYTGQTGFLHVRAGTTAKIFKGAAGNDLLYSSDNAQNISTIYSAEDVYGLDSTPGGLYLMGAWSSAGRRGRSSDGGVSWGTMTNLVYGSYYNFRWAGGVDAASKWIATNGGAIIRYSPDWGTTWSEQKNGDLTTLIPIPAISTTWVHGLTIT